MNSDEILRLMEMLKPPWVEEFRDHQVAAIVDIVQAFETVNMVCLDGPTGAGKTLIGEMVRRVLGARSIYVCSDKSLQHQFLRDFPDASLMMGRANYTPTNSPHPDTTCADCDGVRNCSWCPSTEIENGKVVNRDCEYLNARDAAMANDLVVANSAYWLTEANGPGRFRGRELAIVDEAETIEQVLLGQAEVRLSKRQLADAGTRAPKKGVHLKTIQGWLEMEVLPGLQELFESSRDLGDKTGMDTYGGKLGTVRKMLRSLQEGEPWVRDYPGFGSFAMKPVMLDGIAQRSMWGHAEKFLFMSGTLIDSGALLWDLGWKYGYQEISLPMSFPVENRPINLLPVANMSKKMKEQGSWDVMVEGILEVLRRHPDEKVLIHTVNYELTKKVTDAITERPVYTYGSAGERDQAVDAFTRSTDPAVLVAPSLERGLDLPGDLCRVVIVAKAPFPYLKDPRTSARLNDTATGQTWYTIQTVRSMVQMTGRAVRSEEDHAVSYVLDAGATALVSKNRRLFPEWWLDATQTPYPPSSLLGRK